MQKYLIINSNTKEDGEVWYLARGEDQQDNALPAQLIKREKDVKAFVDHIRVSYHREKLRTMLKNLSRRFSKQVHLYK